MNAGSFAGHLAGLDEAALADLLRLRRDVRAEPVPRGFTRLAQRLGGPDSLAAALRAVNRDAIVVGQAVAALRQSATVATVARLLGAPEIQPRQVHGPWLDSWCHLRGGQRDFTVANIESVAPVG